MKLEQRLHDELHRAPLPAHLAPPPDLAGVVLRELRRRRRRTLAATVGVVAVVAVAVPLALTQVGVGAGSHAPAAPRFDPVLVFPAPGGGPQAIHVYAVDQPTRRSFLLDPGTGGYRGFEFEDLVLSPDLDTVAVSTVEGRIGVADRAELLADGDPAVDWTDLPPGNGLAWSPDGSALLVTSIAKDDATRTTSFTAHRYDLAGGTVTSTPIPIEILGSAVGWAADSRRYVALLPGERGTDTVEPGALRYLEPDGTPGDLIEIDGGMVRGAQSYSPSREWVIVDSSVVMSAERVPPRIVDVATSEVVATLPQGRPVGWYDEDTVIMVGHRPTRAEPRLELVDVATGRTDDVVTLDGLPLPTAIQVGASDALTGQAAERGF